MALRHPNATYLGRNSIRDPQLQDSLDDIASQIAFARQNTNASENGIVSPPPAPVAIEASASGGFLRLTIMHPEAPPGAAYMIQYDTSPTFPNPVEIDNGISKSFQQYLAGQTIYVRVAATFYTSEPSPFVYFGGTLNPTPITI